MSFKIFRKYQKASLWVLVVITVCTFSLFSVSSAMRTCFRAPGDGDEDYGNFTLPDGTTLTLTFEQLRDAGDLIRKFTRKSPDNDAVTTHVILHEEAKRAGLAVSDRELQTQIKAMLNQFFGEKPTVEQYRLAYRDFFGFLTPQAFEDCYREVILVDKLKAFYKMPDDCVLTENLYEKYKIDNEEFKVDYLTFAVADCEEEYPADAVEEEDLKKHYDRIRVGMGNEEYSEAERFTLDFASVDLSAYDFEKYAELTKETVIEEDQIENHYTLVRERFLIEDAEDAGTGDASEDDASEDDASEGDASEKDGDDAEKKEPQYRPLEEVKDLIEKELKIIALIDKAHTEWVDFVTENDLLEKLVPPVVEEKEGEEPAEEASGEASGETSEETPEDETPDADAFFKDLCEKYQFTYTRTDGAVSWDDLTDYELFGSETFKARIRMQNGNSVVVMKPGREGDQIAFIARVVEKVPVRKKELSEIRDLLLTEFVKMKRMDLAYEKANKFRESLQEKAREFEDLKPEIEKIESELAAAFEEKIKQKSADESFTEEEAEKLREEGKRRAKGQVDSLLEKHLHRAYGDVCAEKGVKPVVIDTFSKAVARDPEALEGDSPGDRFIKKHPLILRSQKNVILRPLRAEQESACYLVHVIDRSFPAPERMTSEDVNDGLGQIRMDKMMAMWRSRQSGEVVPDARFDIESIMTDFKVNLYRKAESEEEETEE